MKYILMLALLVSSSAFAMRTSNIPILTNGNMSVSANGSSTLASSPILLDQILFLSIQAVVGDSTAIGGLSLQASDDMGSDLQGSGISNWSSVAGSSTAVVGTSSYLFNYPNMGHRWMRMIYSKTAGSGPINARANIKGE